MSVAVDPHTQRNVSLPGSQEKKASVCKKGLTHVQQSVKVLQNFISWHNRSFNHLLSPPIAQKNKPRLLLIYDVSYMDSVMENTVYKTAMRGYQDKMGLCESL